MMRSMEKRLSPLVYKVTLTALATLLLPVHQTAFAQEASTDTPVQEYLVLFLLFINNLLLPLLFSIALLFFLINIARYFIFKGASDSDREKARKYALYGIGAFVILVSLWGVVNMFVYGLDIDSDEALCPDYLGDWCYSKYDGTGGSDNSFYEFDDWSRSSSGGKF